MNPKLLSSKYVPAGFEIVIGDTDVEIGKIWNVWWNITLSDDPEKWDAEVTLINTMQENLSDITTDQRLIRAHMAEFCRRHPLFPHSIDMLCKEIGSGEFSTSVKIGCEGRGLLDTLGYHDPESMKNQRKALFNEYVRSLTKWLTHDCPETPSEFKVFQFLGHRTDATEAFVEELISTISEEPSVTALKKLCETQCRKTHKSLFERDWAPFPFKCFTCHEGCPEGAFTPVCPCCDAMILNSGLLCAGVCSERSMAHEFRHFIEEYILGYAGALNSWLKDSSPTVTLLKSAQYITEENALQIAERVHSFLGEKDEAKKWLTACLLKTIKDSHKGHPEDGVKRPELIDDVPEAVSWFREMF